MTTVKSNWWANGGLRMAPDWWANLRGHHEAVAGSRSGLRTPPSGLDPSSGQKRPQDLSSSRRSGPGPTPSSPPGIQTFKKGAVTKCRRWHFSSGKLPRLYQRQMALLVPDICRLFFLHKLFIVNHKNLSFIRDQYGHLAVCLHLIEPNWKHGS